MGGEVHASAELFPGARRKLLCVDRVVSAASTGDVTTLAHSSDCRHVTALTEVGTTVTN
jgi:hypothetical protein